MLKGARRKINLKRGKSLDKSSPSLSKYESDDESTRSGELTNFGDKLYLPFKKRKKHYEGTYHI